MYGLVNKAVEDLVRSRFGDDTWEKIKQQAGVEDEIFISMDAYPDDVTYRLVGAASAVLGISAAQVLEAFGEYWVVYTAKEGYGDTLKMFGDTLPAFLINLDTMHAHVATVFPDLKPPSFRCSDMTDHGMRLHYYSTRAGLAPMVIGLLRGLGVMFNVDLRIAQEAYREAGADHDEFVVEYAPKEQHHHAAA